MVAERAETANSQIQEGIVSLRPRFESRLRHVLGCAVICRTKVGPFGDLVPRTAATQKGLETCSVAV